MSTELAGLLDAIAFAAEKHRNQRRKDREASPYINHPIALANLLSNEVGIGDLATLQAAVLHDTVEDTNTSHEELVRRFGARVADIVAEVTDDKSLDKAERKRLQVENAPHMSPEATLVKMADKICNLRDMNAAPPAHWDLERRRAYFEWARAVVDGLPPTDPRLLTLFSAAYALRP